MLMITDDEFPGVFYGFPILPPASFEGPIGFKLAYHYPGERIDPDSIDRNPSLQEEQLLIRFMQRYFPDQYLSTVELKTCMYTNSPDEHFILDFLPGFDQNVMVATGFSGHGFKFASVIGEIMSDLAIWGRRNCRLTF
jgi:sarcosine oxidase